MKPEVWRDIPEFSNYRISTYGRIAGKKRKKVLNPTPDKDGYLGTTITNDNGKRKSIKAHRMTLITFKGPPPFPDAQALHHPDPDVTNNHITNLRWGDNFQNQVDYLKEKTHHNQHGDCLTEDQVIDIKNRILAGQKYSDIQLVHNVSETIMTAIRIGNKYSYYGPDITHLHNLRQSRVFTDDEIRDIRSSSKSNSDEARNRGVTPPCISKIRLGRTYGDVI